MNIEQEIFEARSKRWAQLVAQKADQITRERQHCTDLMIQILNGDIFNEAVDRVALDIQNGCYDKMLMPIECNL